MANLLNFRKNLCEIGRALFDEMPTVSGSYGQYNTNNEPKFELTHEEIAYNQHISNCKVCSEVANNKIK